MAATSGRVGRPMREFDATRPAVLRDRTNNSTYLSSGEQAHPFRSQAVRREDGAVEWRACMVGRKSIPVPRFPDKGRKRQDISNRNDGVRLMAPNSIGSRPVPNRRSASFVVSRVQVRHSQLQF